MAHKSGISNSGPIIYKSKLVPNTGSQIYRSQLVSNTGPLTGSLLIIQLSLYTFILEKFRMELNMNMSLLWRNDVDVRNVLYNTETTFDTETGSQ